MINPKKLSFAQSGFRFVAAVTFIISGLQSLDAQGDLLITPGRIVLQGSKRSVDMNLANTGKDSATYAISLVQMRMTEDGRFETITEPDPDQMFASDYLRFFPRSVTLAPSESQTVKVQLNRTSQLAPGEYRSHFYFRAIPKPVALGTAEKRDTNAISIVIKPVFGITVPAIVRIGESTTRVSITDLALTTKNDNPVCSMTFNRSGNFSVYGDLAIFHISPDGKQTKVGVANGLAIYTPNPKRTFMLNLSKGEGVDYTKGTIRVTFSAPSDVKAERYAEAEINLN
ncbi:MAG TPA: Fn3-like domain-containing protein [Bacteroidales bacterium]|nr:Fn3-like domain-containing protein [Bacteroidales bacterium]